MPRQPVRNGARLAGLSTVIDQDMDTFDAVIRTNLQSLFYLSHAAIPQMKSQGIGGSIVVTASTAGLFSIPLDDSLLRPSLVIEEGLDIDMRDGRRGRMPWRLVIGGRWAFYNLQVVTEIAVISSKAFVLGPLNRAVACEVRPAVARWVVSSVT